MLLLAFTVGLLGGAWLALVVSHAMIHRAVRRAAVRRRLHAR